MKEYFHSDDEIISWLNDFAARQTDFEDSLRLTEISIKLKMRSKHIKLDSPVKCDDCKSMYTIGLCYFCHMAAISPDNSQQDISTIYVDPNSKPDWCPIDKVNTTLEEMSPEKREKADMIMKGMSAFFGSDGMLSGEKEKK